MPKKTKITETYSLPESFALLDSQWIRLGNDGDNIDDFRELFEHDDVDGFQPKWNFGQRTDYTLYKYLQHTSDPRV